MSPSRAVEASSVDAWITLIKAPLCLPIALSSGFGYILQTRQWDMKLLLVMLGVFLLASGAATLNSLQEIHVDALFSRTGKRPLVTGALSPRSALLASLLLFISAFVIFSRFVGSLQPLILAVIGPVVYNGIYTPLKHKNGFALLIGGVAGAIPPLIGWSSGGGALSDVRALVLALLFFLWQVPHFFVILLNHQQDYRSANIYNLTVSFSEGALRRLALVWTASLTTTALTMSAMPSFLVTASRAVNLAAAITIFVVVAFTLILKKKPSYSLLFHSLNTVFFADMAILSVTEVLLSP